MIPEEKINSNPANDAAEVIEVDLNEAVEVEDATADVNVAATLPPRGIYPVKFKAGKDDHPYAGKGKKAPHRSYVATSLFGQIVDEGGDFDGAGVFENHINSLAMQRKPTSDLHHFLNVAGAPISNRTTIGELLEHTKELLEQEPVVMVELDWRASYKQDDGTYKDVATSMDKFPKHYVDPEGNPLPKEQGGKWAGAYEQTIPNPKDGEPIQAQLYIRKYLSQADAKKLQGS